MAAPSMHLQRPASKAFDRQGRQMPDLEYRPVLHRHDDFLAQARVRPGFAAAYDALANKYLRADRLIRGRATASDSAALAPAPGQGDEPGHEPDTGECLASRSRMQAATWTGRGGGRMVARGNLLDDANGDCGRDGRVQSNG